MKKLKQRSTWNQLLAVPLRGLPATAKPPLGISPSLPGRFTPQATSSLLTHGIFPEQNSPPCNSRFLAFSCISQNSVKKRLAAGSSNYRRRLPTPTSPRSGRRRGRFYTLSSLRHREAGCHCSSVFGRDKKCSTKSTLPLSRV